jgi:hypothetical protein
LFFFVFGFGVVGWLLGSVFALACAHVSGAGALKKRALFLLCGSAHALCRAERRRHGEKNTLSTTTAAHTTPKNNQTTHTHTTQCGYGLGKVKKPLTDPPTDNSVETNFYAPQPGWRLSQLRATCSKYEKITAVTATCWSPREWLVVGLLVGS